MRDCAVPFNAKQFFMSSVSKSNLCRWKEHDVCVIVEREKQLETFVIGCNKFGVKVPG